MQAFADQLKILNHYFEDWPTDDQAANATDDDFFDAEDDEVIHFARAGGWQCLVNFSAHPRPVPPGEVLLSSSPIHDGMLPGEATVWLKGPPRVAGS